MQFQQALLASGVTAPQRNWLPHGVVELVEADGAGQEVRPLWRLNRHFFLFLCEFFLINFAAPIFLLSQLYSRLSPFRFL